MKHLVAQHLRQKVLTCLIERVPADAGAVILIRVNDLLEKGREDIAALLPPGLPPMVGKYFKTHHP